MIKKNCAIHLNKKKIKLSMFEIFNIVEASNINNTIIKVIIDIVRLKELYNTILSFFYNLYIDK